MKPLPFLLHSWACALALSPLASAQDGTRALLIVDPENPESMYVAHHYQALYDIPQSHVIYMDPGGESNYAVWSGLQRRAFLDTLAARGIDDSIDFVILPPGDHFWISASGLVSDGCAAVNHFSVPSAYALAHQSADLLSATWNSSERNHFSDSSWGPRAFHSDIPWRNGVPSTAASAQRYYLGTMLGWTGMNGNTLSEVLEVIDRSHGVRGTAPAGTVYYMQTTDAARSAPRHGLFPTAVTQMGLLGGLAQHLFAVLPLGQTDALGVMTGAANPDIADPTYALLPGSFADHLTSYAGALLNNSQTKMTLWLTKGASGTSGAIEEPCNYSGKFPTAALHTSYRGGTTLGEAWFRHMGFVPLQTLFLGDPLTRPWTQNNPVAVNNAPVGPWSGSWDLDVSATAALPGATIATLELWLDGVRLARVAAPGPLQLESGGLADGLHEVRVRAIDDSAAEHAGEWSGWIQVANAGLSVDLTCAQPAGDLAQVYTFDFAVTGGVPERVQLLRGGRVVASSPQGSGSVDLYGSSLGAGPVRVIAEARFAGGLRARSAPVDLQIDYSGAASAVPIAFDADLDAAARGTVLVELPASAPDPGFDLTYTVLSAPAQATLVGGFGSWRVYDVPATAYGEDNLTFQVTGPAGPSNPATVTLHYQNECPDPYVYCTASANSTGAPAHIFHTGSTQISQDQFILGAYSVPAGSFGLFVYGQDQTAFPAGDGTFCMQNNWQRLPIVQADPFGLVSHALDFQNPPQPTGMITAGSTWGFQLWYRDTGFGQAGYNFTDALSVTFCD